MAYLLVDDRDGRVIGEFESRQQAARLLERITRRHAELAQGLCLVSLHESTGSLAAASGSTTIRVAPELPGAPGVPDLRG